MLEDLAIGLYRRRATYPKRPKGGGGRIGKRVSDQASEQSMELFAPRQGSATPVRVRVQELDI